MDVYSAQSMKNIDGYAINTLGIPSDTLMETAAGLVFAKAEAAFGSVEGKTCAVFCGSGNNGGDGVAVSRLILENGGRVRCFLVGKRKKMTTDCRLMEQRLESKGGKVEDFDYAEVKAYLENCDLVFDAMFGIGLNSDMRSPGDDAVSLINESAAKVVAVDISSGVCSDTGKIMGCAVNADLTVTFTAPKAGHILPPGCFCRGQLEVVDINIPAEAIATEEPIAKAADSSLIASLLPPRPQDSHKGDFGKVLIIGGSIGYTGAPSMAAKAALRCGSGLVFLGVPERIYTISAVKNDEAMVFPLPCDDSGRLTTAALPEILDRLNKADVCLIGPGLGQSEELDKLVWQIVSRSNIPLVIDADGINALSRNINVLKTAACPVVLTPHDGEFARLGGNVSDKVRGAKDFAVANGCTLVSKGHRTVTSAPDGNTVINTTGNAGMAAGGSGDVLAGMVASLMGQGLSPFDAAFSAVWLHGKAGDLCAGMIGQYGMLPTDIIDALPGLLP
ncbi:MAG: NAD(P)H-hydrate dehydratase [Ruminococcaceae bacterium]|nr:NAD(P)H-hydrate dehydratase [Oscillospiraceae bacterium]